MSGIITQIFMYVVIWWLTLFVVLPWGVQRREQSEIGHDPGAPAHPMLYKKAIATTIIAAVIWGAVFVFFHIYGFTLLQLIDKVEF